MATHDLYMLRSEAASERYDTGVTGDPKARIVRHNTGKVAHTSKYRPWILVAYVAFSEEAKAFAFEKYLKSASGRAFAKKRF